MINFLKLFLIYVFMVSVVFFGSGLASSAKELSIGLVPGGGVDAVFDQDAFNLAKIQYKAFTKDDYQLANIMNFDVIAVGVMAYDQNADLQANFQNLNEYVKRGGYLVTVDYQQDATWKAEYLPYPIALLDANDVDEGVEIEIKDHQIWNTPNKITKDNFVGWGVGDFVADAPNEAKDPWKTLLIANNWPVVVGASYGQGYVVFSSLQIIQALGRTSNPKIAEVLQNFLLWRGALAVDPKGCLSTTWAHLKINITNLARKPFS